MERTITVSATGTVEAEPDQARITSGVTTEATSAREALTGNSEAMTKVISQLKAKGIDAKDIQTASFNVEPLIDYSKDGQPPKTRGYRVSNQVVILVRVLSRLGTVLDDVITAGANQVQGLSFEVSKADTLKDEARKEAVANALRRAKLLAAAAGAEVGEGVADVRRREFEPTYSLRYAPLCQSRDVRSDRTRHKHPRSPRHYYVGIEVGPVKLAALSDKSDDFDRYFCRRGARLKRPVAVVVHLARIANVP